MRGYNVGELATCRRYAEAAAELRVPVLGQQLFAFAEWGSDLGSSGANGELAARRGGRWWCVGESGVGT